MTSFSDEHNDSLIRGHKSWQLILAGTAAQLPEQVPALQRSTQRMGFGGGGARGSSAQTRLDWSWSLDDSHRHSGGLVWPQDYNRAGYDHAVKLLQIAEASFVESCPQAPLPQWLTEPRRLQESSAELMEELRGLADAAVCPQ